jgi:hypothetical protein
MVASCDVKDVTERGQEFTGPGFSQVEGLYYAEFLKLPSFRAKVESVTVAEDNLKGRPYLFVAMVKENGEKVGLCELSPNARLRECVLNLKTGESYLFPDAIRMSQTPHSEGKR